MDPFPWLMGAVDACLITPYRWPQNAVIGWWTGTTVLAFWATLFGEITTALVFKVNRSHMRGVWQEMEDRHSQSIKALKAGDGEAYRGINKLANEAFGKAFFLQIAMASASLWPIPFALAWLQTRFSSVRFPLPFNLPGLGDGVGHPFVFIPLYILVRIAFGKIKSRIAYARA